MNTYKKRILGLTLALCVSPICADLRAAEPDAPAQQAANERRIDVLEYRIDGNTVLSPEEIEAAVQPYLGPQRTVAEIQQARETLEQAYRKRGYETVGVEIPEQDVRTGVVRFKVTELRVGRLRITGSRYYSPEHIKERVPSLREGVVPRQDLVSRDIQAINNARDRTITPSLREGTAPDTFDVDLEVEDRAPVHGSFEINDRYSAHTSRLRAVVSASYANLFQRDHSLNLQAQAAPEKLSESMVVSASYVAPIADTPFSLIAFGVRSDSDVAAVNGIDVLGKGNIVGLRGAMTLPAGKSYSHSIIAGFDYKDFKETLAMNEELSKTPIDYIPFRLEYSLSALSGADYAGRTELRTSLNWGTRGLDSSNEEFALKRYQARPNYFYVNADVKHVQSLPKDFLVTAAVSAQIADQPLISNEGFSIGGMDSVRGYAEAEALGDDGLRASLEIHTPSFVGRLSPIFNEWRFFVFGDWGQVRIKEALPDLQGVRTDEITLASVGLGTQLQMFDTVNALLMVAEPLEDAEGLELDIDNKYRAHFRVWAEF